MDNEVRVKDGMVTLRWLLDMTDPPPRMVRKGDPQMLPGYETGWNERRDAIEALLRVEAEEKVADE